MSVADLSDGASLAPFVDLAKTYKDPNTLIPFIKQVIGAPGVYVFGELLDMENIRSLANGDDQAKQHWELLNIFAYGTMAEYKSKQASLPKLTKVQEIKLKQLTIVSLASRARVIPYATLQQHVDVSNVRELEDLIIDSIYQGLLVGKLDQRKSEFQVDETFGRDVRPAEVQQLFHTLDGWASQSDSLLKIIEEKINWAQKENARAKKHKDEFTKQLDDMKATVKAAIDTDGPDSGGAQFDGDGMDDKRRKAGRTKGKGPKDREGRERHNRPGRNV